MKIEKRMLPTNQVRAPLKTSSIDVETRRVTLTWATDTAVIRSHWGEQFNEVLSFQLGHVDLSRLQGGPLLADHVNSVESVIGVIERVWIEGNAGKAVVKFDTDEKSTRIFEKVKSGSLRSTSVGYAVRKYQAEESQSEIPVYRAVSWVPHEISIVGIPADPNSGIRSQTETENEVEIIYRSLSEGTMQMKEENERKESPAVLAERERVMQIRKAVKDADMDASLADTYIENGNTLKDALAGIQTLVKYRDSSQLNQISSVVRVELPHTKDNETKRRELFIEANVARIVPEYKPSQDARMFQGQSLIRSIEHLYGRRVGESDVSLAQRAMSTSDFPLLLSNLAEKSLQQRYALAPRSFSNWVKKDTLRNFKEAAQLRAGDFPSLSERQEGAEYQYGSFGEEQELISLKEYGKIVSFTYRAIVNDDLKALAQVSNEGAISAARLERDLVYSALTTATKVMGDGIQLYHADHANVGSAAVIGDASVSEAFKLMRKQRTVDGLDTVNVAPAFLICGPDKEGEALKYLAAISPNQSSNVNPYSGRLELVVDAKITGNQYYFAAAPSVMPSVVLFFLEGQESPRIESRTDFNTDSLQLKVAHACNAAPMDWRSLVKNAGA